MEALAISRGEQAPASAGVGRLLLPLAVGGGAFVFYYLTLAPSLLWGDDAGFQRGAYLGTIGSGSVGHWLWLQAARMFVRLPLGDVAYRVNLVSATAGALTIFFLVLAARAFGLSQFGAAVAAVSLAVSHTFWTHAVRAEVYTVFTAAMALELWLWGLWRAGDPWPMRAAALLFGVVLLGHQMAVLLLPAWGLWLWLRRDWLGWKESAVLLALFVAGLALFGGVVQGMAGSQPLLNSLVRYFTGARLNAAHTAVVDYTEYMFNFTLRSLPRDTALWLGFLGLQFVGLAGVLGLWAVYRTLRGLATPRVPWRPMLLLYITSVLFAFAYHVNDQFVFYLPSYVCFALFAGLGWDLARAAWGRLGGAGARAGALAALALVPPLVYYGLATGFTALQLNPLGIRELPGREPNRFFLWPAKNGYYGAAEYGRQALATLPQGAYLLASFTPYESLSYMQVVEGLRPDVHLQMFPETADMGQVLGTLPEGAVVYLADDDLRYYDLKHVPEAQLEREGVVYRLVLPP